MPELPEVEVTRLGIAPHLEGRVITAVTARDSRLRWPIPAHLPQSLPGQRIAGITRRAKYLLIACERGYVIVHLGMSGSLRVVAPADPPGPHDHFDLVVGDRAIRLRDPRRFGSVLWHEGDPAAHPLLAHLGMEPLDDRFDGPALHRATRGLRTSIKTALMDHRLVVGVGNIYASESLFRARIRPTIRASRLSRAASMRLALAVRATLLESIEAGGSSLRDFMRSDGQPGYFQMRYYVYGRDGQPCRLCGNPIRRTVQGQRATFWCSSCQRS